jgi:hypothetical protein
MTPEESAHLSEEAINDVLIGLGSLESEAHLALCSTCRGKLKEFRSEMLNFNQASLAWSEARPAAALGGDRGSRVRRAISSPWSWAIAAAVLMVAIGLSLWNHNYSSIVNNASINDASGPAQSAEDSEAQIAQDNDLLRSVNMALSENEESPINEYHLSEGPHARSKARPELGNR